MVDFHHTSSGDEMIVIGPVRFILEGRRPKDREKYIRDVTEAFTKGDVGLPVFAKPWTKLFSFTCTLGKYKYRSFAVKTKDEVADLFVGFRQACLTELAQAESLTTHLFGS